MRKNDSTKTRWLKIASPNEQGNEHILALVKTIDGIEMKVIQGVTYVRLPEIAEKTSKKHRPRFSTYLPTGGLRTTSSEKKESERLYCAVMLK